MGGLTRRGFFKQSAAAAAGVAAPAIVPSNVLARPGNPGANDRIVIGGIGIGVMGSSLMRAFSGFDDVRVAAVCDVDMRKANEAADGLDADAYSDYRELLEREDIDAVVIATPHHWHAVQTVHAAQAGKDIYCEKCLSHTIREGRLMAEAAHRHGRVLQTGSQQRSSARERVGCEFVREGGLGAIERVAAHHYMSPWLNGLPDEPIPDGLDWDMWCGPVQPQPYNHLLTADTDEFTYGAWYSTRAFGGGEICCFGPHGLDIVQWALGMDEAGPEAVWTEGEPFAPEVMRPALLDGEPASYCHHCYHSTELRGLAPKLYMRYPGGVEVEFGEAISSGARFTGEGGELTISRNTLESEPGDIAAELLEKAEADEGQTENHHRNWLNCIKDRGKPVADVEIGHRSATVCHLGNIARWVSEVTGETGDELQWDAQAERFTNSEWGNHFLDRPRRAPFQLPDDV